jgi:hypothetical protein
MYLRVREVPGIPLHEREAAQLPGRVDSLTASRGVLGRFTPRLDCSINAPAELQRLRALL